MKSRRKIRYAVVGLGHIAQAAVLPAFRNAKSNSELVALVSGNEKKLRQLSRRYKVKMTATYDRYEELLESGAIDAVYIATPNTDHRWFAERAAEKGVHVLCEKPLAGDQESCHSMIRKARENKVQAMVAYRLHFDPANLKAVEVAQSKKLGELRFFSSIFSFSIQDEDNIRLKVDKAGGPLHDIGVYCINAARYLFRDEPTEVFAFAATNPHDGRFKEVDEMLSVLMKFPRNRLAQFTCGFGATPTARYELVGTRGALSLDSAYEYTSPMEMTITVKEKSRRLKFKKTDQFGPEISYFSDCILKGRAPEPSFVEGLADVAIVEAILESLQRRTPVRVARVQKEIRPTPSQKMRRPPVQKPPVLHAASPSGD